MRFISKILTILGAIIFIGVLVALIEFGTDYLVKKNENKCECEKQKTAVVSENTKEGICDTELYDAALEKNQNSPELIAAKAITIAQCPEKQAEALSFCEQVKTIAPENPSGWTCAAMVYAQMGNKEMAEANYWLFISRISE